MKKNEIIANFVNYRNYTIKNDCHVKPTKGVNSGNAGRTAEIAVKLALNNIKGAKGISSPTQKDTYKKLDGIMTSFEVKSGCGVLANIDESGNYYGAMLKSEYVIYTPEYDPTFPICYQAYVLLVEDFIEILKEIGLIRLKMSGAQYSNGQRKENAFYDRLTIQTFTNSKKKTALLYENLNRYADTMEDFFSRYGVKISTEF